MEPFLFLDHKTAIVIVREFIVTVVQWWLYLNQLSREYWPAASLLHLVLSPGLVELNNFSVETVLAVYQ